MALVVGAAALTACGASEHHSLADTKKCLVKKGYDAQDDHALATLGTLTTTIQAEEAVIMFFWRDADEAKYRVDHDEVPTDLDHEQHGNVVVVWAGYVPNKLKSSFRACL